MKKFLLIAVVATCNMMNGDLQAMWIREKIRKILPKRNHALSTIAATSSNRGEIFPDATEKEDSLKNNFIPSAPPSQIAQNRGSSTDLYDVKLASSESTVTSSRVDNNASTTSDYITIEASRFFQEEEIFTLIEAVRTPPNFDNILLSYDEEEIFDMEMSERSQAKHTMSEQYFSDSCSENQPHTQERREENTSKKSPTQQSKRRKSSIDLYYRTHK